MPLYRVPPGTLRPCRAVAAWQGRHRRGVPPAKSLGSIAPWLNESAVLTPWNATRKRNGKPTKDSASTSASVRKILGSATLGAAVKTDGAPVRDAEGVVIYRADALVTRDVWERVQARQQANPVSAKVNRVGLNSSIDAALSEPSCLGRAD